MLNYKINCLGKIIFSSVQLLSHIWLFAISWSHARPPCPSPTPRVNSNSRPSSQWCHPDISSSVIPLYSCPQFLPASESFPMSQLFAWGGQSTGVSALASFPPKKSQGWSPSEWTGWISLIPGLSLPREDSEREQRLRLELIWGCRLATVPFKIWDYTAKSSLCWGIRSSCITPTTDFNGECPSIISKVSLFHWTVCPFLSCLPLCGLLLHDYYPMISWHI